MDNKQKLQDLEKKYESLRESKNKIKEEVGNFEQTEEYEKYQKYLEDEDIIQILIEFPMQHAMYMQISEINDKIEKIYDEQIDTVRNLHRELDEDIAKLEGEINTNKEYIEKLEQEIKSIEEKIKLAKDTEAYKNGDEEALLEVQELESNLESKKSFKEKTNSEIEEIQTEVEKVKQYKQKLIDDWGKDLAQPVGQTQEEATETPQENDENKEQPKGKNEQSKVKGNNEGQTIVSNSDEQSEDKKLTQEELDEKLKEEFKELYKKAKDGKLTSEDFKAFSEIMKNKENYDKLNITTGVVFNKAKVIFKAMAKTTDVKGISLKNYEEKLEAGIADASEILKQDRETLSDEEKIKWDAAKKRVEQYEDLKAVFNVYGEVSKERKEQSRSWLSKRRQAKTEALPPENDKGNNEAGKEDKSNDMQRANDMQIALKGNVNENPDYINLPANSSGVEVKTR